MIEDRELNFAEIYHVCKKTQEISERFQPNEVNCAVLGQLIPKLNEFERCLSKLPQDIKSIREAEKQEIHRKIHLAVRGFFEWTVESLHLREFRPRLFDEFHEIEKLLFTSDDYYQWAMHKEGPGREEIEKLPEREAFIKALENIHLSWECFVCYPHGNRPEDTKHKTFVEIFVEDLRRTGLKVYYDKDHSGTDLDRFSAKISTCDYVFLVGSPSTVDKYTSFCETQISREIPLIKSSQLKPILLAGHAVTSFPGVHAHSRKLYKNFRKSEDYIKSFNSLLEELAPSYKSQNSCDAASKKPLPDKPLAPTGSTSQLDFLYTFYKEMGIIKRFYDELNPLEIENVFVTLSIIFQEEVVREEMDLKGKTVAKDERDDEISSFERLMRTQEPLEIQKIFSKIKDYQPKRRVLIEGGAGMGKTTLFQYIANLWVNNRQKLGWGNKYQAVVWIKFRDFVEYSDAKDCYDALSKIYSEQGVKISENVLRKELQHLEENGRVLYLLDGYDEIRESQDEGNLRSIVDVLLKKPDWILSSRPNEYDRGLKDVRKLELLGFTEKKSNEYIKRFFDEQNAINGQAKKLIKIIKGQPNLQTMVQVPINLELICSMFHLSPEEISFQSLTTVYDGMFVGILRRYFGKEKLDAFSRKSLVRLLMDLGYEREGGFDFLSMEKLLGCFSSKDLRSLKEETTSFSWDSDQLIRYLPEGMISYIEQIAWKGMNGKKFVFKPERGRVGSQPHTKSFIRTALYKLGFTRRMNKCKDVFQETYYFQHLTFQEYFAARYFVSKIVQGHEIEVSAGLSWEDWIHRYKFNPRYSVVLWFTAGLMFNCQVGLERFLKVLLDPTHCSAHRIYETCLAARCLAEVSHSPDIYKRILQKNEVVEAVVKLLRAAGSNSPDTLFLQSKAFDISFGSLIPLLRGSATFLDDLRIEAVLVDNAIEVVDFCADLRLYSPRLINYFLTLLKDPQSNVSTREAAKALGKIVPPGSDVADGVVETLVGLLKDPDEFVCIYAAESLFRIVPSRSDVIETIKESIVDILKHPKLELCGIATSLLIRIPTLRSNESKSYINTLVSNLRSRSTKESWPNLGAADEVLLSKTRVGSSGSDKPVINVVNELRFNVEIVVRLVTSRDVHIRECAIDELVKIASQGSKEVKVVIEGIVSFLIDCDFCNRISNGVGETIGFLYNNSADYLEYIVGALFRIASFGPDVFEAELEVLLGRLNDPDIIVRIQVAHVLARILCSDSEQLRVVIQALGIVLKVSNFSYKAVDVLISIAHRGSERIKADVEAHFVDFLIDPNEEFRISAADALVKIAPQASETRELALETLACLLKYSENSVSKLEGVLSSDQWAAQILIKSASQGSDNFKTAIQYLMCSLKNPETSVRFWAARVLVSTPPKSLGKVVFVEALEEFFKSNGSDLVFPFPWLTLNLYLHDMDIPLHFIIGCKIKHALFRDIVYNIYLRFTTLIYIQENNFNIRIRGRVESIAIDKSNKKILRKVAQWASEQSPLYLKKLSVCSIV